MSAIVNLTGNIYGRLKVIARAGSSKDGKSTWQCRCICGNEIVVPSMSLRSGNTRSCGCLLKETQHKRFLSHGMSTLPEYKIWKGMRVRCNNRNRRTFDYYGGRGIRVCKRWDTFENFYADMGKRPSVKHSLERVKNDGNYEPGNCCWATSSEQASNRRQIRITIGRTTKTAIEWAKSSGIGVATIRTRVRAGITGRGILEVGTVYSDRFEIKSKLLRQIRHRKHLTQRELSRVSGVSIAYICNLETGAVPACLEETINKIAAALQVHPSLLTGRRCWGTPRT